MSNPARTGTDLATIGCIPSLGNDNRKKSANSETLNDTPYYGAFPQRTDLWPRGRAKMECIRRIGGSLGGEFLLVCKTLAVRFL